MNVFSRGVRNAFRNFTRSIAIIVIIGLSIGLSLAMFIAHQAVGNKIISVKQSVGNTISISPAGLRGFEGGGNPLTAAQIASIKSLPHISDIEEDLSDHLTSSQTNLVSSVDAGSLGRRFAGNDGQSFGPPPGLGEKNNGGAVQGNTTASFTPPITVTGTNNPSNASMAGQSSQGSFKLISGKLFSSSSTDSTAVVGKNLASKNNLKTGSTFMAYGTTITVAGIFDSGNTFGNNQLLMPLATVQKLSSQTGDITSATVTADSISNVSSLTSAIKTKLGSAADVTNAAERAQRSIQPLQNIQSISLYSFLGAVLAGAVIVLLSMVMVARERRREIGVLKAIGASNIKVVSQFVVESLTLTGVGAVAGIVLGALLASPITRTLVSSNTGQQGMGAMAGGPMIRGTGVLGGFRRNLDTIHVAVGWSIIADGLVIALIIAVIGSAVTSFFIAKVRPSEVMRTE